MRMRLSIAAVLLGVMSAASVPALARAPFTGTLKVDYALVPTSANGSAVTGGPADGVTGTYSLLHASRWRGPSAPKNAYVLTGRGTESVNVFRHDVSRFGSTTYTSTDSIKASGAVRIVGNPAQAGDVGALSVRLLPKGRFMLNIEGLELGLGLPVTYTLEDDTVGSCEAGGENHTRATYEDGLFTFVTLEQCPNEIAPAVNYTKGARYQQGILAASVWTTESASEYEKPDLCHHKTVFPGQNLNICGTITHGRIHGSEAIGPYTLPGRCPFYPLESKGIAIDSPPDPFYIACATEPSRPLWRAKLTVRWDLSA